MSAFRQTVVVVCAILAFVSLFEPSGMLRQAVLAHFNYPPYEGLWILIPHLFLYSTLAALVCALFWLALSAAGWIEGMRFGVDGRVIFWAVAGGAVSVAMTLAFFANFTPPGTLHWIPPDGWKIAGNLFSNFFEEFIYRGFLLTAFSAVFGFWPSAILTSAMFGATHFQYPIQLRALVAAVGFVWCVIKRLGSSSIWAPYGAHMIADVIIDSLVA